MKILKTVISVTMLACALSFTSCSDEPADVKSYEPVKNGQIVQGPVDLNALSRYESALEDATYTRSYYSLYRMDEWTNNRWEPETDDLIGYYPSTPSSIVVLDGKVWTPIRLSSSACGPSAFSTALGALNTKLETKYYVYVVRPFEVNVEEYTLTLNGSKYDILTAFNDNLVLSSISDYSGGRTGNGGRYLEIGFYEKTEPLSLNESNDLGFDSVTEAYNWMIEQFHENFGEKVNLNKLYYPQIILDNPHFYLSTLEAERDNVANK